MNNIRETIAELPVAAYSTDGEGFINSYNKEAAALWGQHHSTGTRRWYGAWRMRSSDGEILTPNETPLAVAFRDLCETSRSDVIMERADGHRSCTTVHVRLRLVEGVVVSSLVLLIEQTPDPHCDMVQEKLAAIVASSEDIILSKTRDGVVTSWNAAASRILGYSPEEMIGRPITQIIPEDLLDEEKGIIEKICRGDRVEHFVTERLAKSGARVTLCVAVSPLKDRAGNIVGASKIARDVTERKHASGMQRRLFDELDHRVKNTLATVLAFAGLSRRALPDPARFVESFTARVQALARTHNLLVENKMLGCNLARLISKEFNHAAEDDGRATLTGPNISVDVRTAGQLALVLHELASNARRYGALASPDGMLRVKWTTTVDDPTELALHWTESGAPSLIAEPIPGFGISLIKCTIASLDGAVELRFEPDGLRCSIRLPLPNALSENGDATTFLPSPT